MESKQGEVLHLKKKALTVESYRTILKHSVSYRSNKSPYSKRDKERVLDSSRSKCLPRPLKITSNRPSRSDITRPVISDCPRTSSAGPDSIDGSKRITDVTSVKEDGEKTIKIEES